MWRADAGLAVAVIGLCMFAAATRLETSIVTALIAAFIFGHIVFVVSLCRRGTLVAGTWTESPRKLVYIVLGISLSAVFFIWPYSLENASSAQIQSAPDWQVGITYMTPAICASVGSSLLLFYCLCMLFTQVPDIFARMSSRTSVENAEQHKFPEHRS